MSTDTRSESPERTVQVRRCACVIKGGRRFSFAALVVTGNQRGEVGWGYGKATEVPLAIDKAKKKTSRNKIKVSLAGTTIPHQVIGRFGASRVLLMPASPGTGIIAGASVQAVVESVGIKDILTKSRGSNNPINLVKATFNALEQLRTPEEISRLRGVTLK